MASSPITSWQIYGKKWRLTYFIFLVSKITVDDDCSHKIKRRLLLERKAITNLDYILKSRDITLLTKSHLVKAIFPVVMYGCEICTIKKAECQRNWFFCIVVGWHRWLNGHEFEQAQGDSEGQGSLVCCSLWGHRVGYDLATEQQHVA